MNLSLANERWFREASPALDRAREEASRNPKDGEAWVRYLVEAERTGSMDELRKLSKLYQQSGGTAESLALIAEPHKSPSVLAMLWEMQPYRSMTKEDLLNTPDEVLPTVKAVLEYNLGGEEATPGSRMPHGIVETREIPLKDIVAGIPDRSQRFWKDPSFDGRSEWSANDDWYDGDPEAYFWYMDVSDPADFKSSIAQSAYAEFLAEHPFLEHAPDNAVEEWDDLLKRRIEEILTLSFDAPKHVKAWIQSIVRQGWV